MNTIERRRETRRQNAFDRLGTNTPCCCVCGLTDPTCLELHHPAGRTQDDLTVILCRNHHRMLSDPQKDHAFLLAGAEPSLERLFHMCLGLADFFALLAEKLRELVQHLMEANRADEEHVA